MKLNMLMDAGVGGLPSKIRTYRADHIPGHATHDHQQARSLWRIPPMHITDAGQSD